MISLRALVCWIRHDHRRLAVGEVFEVETERHAAGLLARGDAERVAVEPAAPPAPPAAPVAVDLPEPEPLVTPAAAKPARAGKPRKG